MEQQTRIYPIITLNHPTYVPSIDLTCFNWVVHFTDEFNPKIVTKLNAN